jgi:hypothetical protein
MPQTHFFFPMGAGFDNAVWTSDSALECQHKPDVAEKWEFGKIVLHLDTSAL